MPEMKNVLLLQPNFPEPKKIRDPQKYFPFPLIKIGAYYKDQGCNVALVRANQPNNVPFTPDLICVTTVFSWFFPYVKEAVESYRFLYPDARILIGGIHATITPSVYREAFPYAQVHVGPHREAEQLEPLWDLLPDCDTQIDRLSAGCIRKCPFCYGHIEPYQPYPWEKLAKRLRFRKLILNDNNFLAHPDLRSILKNLATVKVNGRNLSYVEVQGGLDYRILARNLDLIPILKEAHFKNIRLAFDGPVTEAGTLEKCLEALDANGYHKRDVRVFMLYNYTVLFEDIIKKLRMFASWGTSVIHSRFRPITQLHDDYKPSCKKQPPGSYYIHPGWTDKQIRVVGSLASDISRLARTSATDDINEVRRFYGRMFFDETVESALEAA
jgi:hypothetical protein